MRALFFISISLIGFISQAQTPDYFINNPSWHCGSWDSDQWNMPSNPYSTDFVYYVHGDTLISGNTYKQLYKRGHINYENTPQQFDQYFDEPTNYFIRQVGRSIYYYAYQNGNIDKLWAKYDYQIGDSLKGNAFTSCGYDQFPIQAKDSILINSEYRYVYFLDTTNSTGKIIVTEGIGHQVGADGEFVQPLCVGMGFSTNINCYGQNEIPLWDAQNDTINCYLNVGLPESESIRFTVWPNPATNFITIQFSVVSSGATIILRDISGKIVCTAPISGQNQTKLDVSHLASGTYIIYYISDQQFVNKKIIIE